MLSTIKEAIKMLKVWILQIKICFCLEHEMGSPSLYRRNNLSMHVKMEYLWRLNTHLEEEKTFLEAD